MLSAYCKSELSLLQPGRPPERLSHRSTEAAETSLMCGGHSKNAGSQIWSLGPPSRKISFSKMYFTLCARHSRPSKVGGLSRVSCLHLLWVLGMSQVLRPGTKYPLSCPIDLQPSTVPKYARCLPHMVGLRQHSDAPLRSPLPTLFKPVPIASTIKTSVKNSIAHCGWGSCTNRI